MSQIGMNEAENKTRCVGVGVNPTVLTKKVLLTDNYLTVWPANDPLKFANFVPYPFRSGHIRLGYYTHGIKAKSVYIFQSAYSIYATGFE